MNPNVTIDGMAGRITDSGVVSFQADERVNVNFYKKSVMDPVKSTAAGRPIYVAKDYVRIQQPGEKDYVDRPVDDDPSVRARWPHHWQRYEQNQQQVPNGTPVEMLFPSSPEIAANLHQLAVHTVEQLAGLTEHGMSTIGMGATQWKEAAKRYLKQSKAGVGHHQMQRELEARDNKIEVLMNQVATLKNQLDRVLAEKSGVPQAMIPTQAPQFMKQASEQPMFEKAADEAGEPTAHGGEVDAMKRNELFAVLREHGIACSPSNSNDELRAKAREALQGAAAA